MNRRLFFKNMLGASLVTILPVPVFSSIIKADKEKPLNWDKKGLWLFDKDNQIIGMSEKDFTIEFERDYNRYDFHRELESMCYLRSRNWNISVKDLKAISEEIAYHFDKVIPLKMLIKWGDVELYGDGDVYITAIETPYMKGNMNIELTGSGKLTRTIKI